MLAPVSVSVASLPVVPVTVDLTSETGAALVRATWKYGDARIVEIPFRAADAAGQPTGAPVTTYDIAPQAGARISTTPRGR